MPYGSIFTRALFGAPAVSRRRHGFFFAEINAVDIEQSEFFQLRNVQNARIITRSESIAAFVAEFCRIGKFADAETVCHDNKNSHILTSHIPELVIIQRSINAVFSHKFFVRAAFFYSVGCKHDNFVGVFNGGKSVRDHYRRSAVGKFL